MPTRPMTRRTLEFHILDVIAHTAHLTGLVAGSASEALQQALADRLIEELPPGAIIDEDEPGETP
jgi:hypothetical protein